VTSSMTSPMVAAMLEVFFRAARDVLMEITFENVLRGTKKIPPIWRTSVDDVIA
jgi:hypothetical protein